MDNDHFTSYVEYNFVVNDNITKDITVDVPSSSPTPTPTPSPAPARTRISISTDATSSVVGSAVNVNGKLVLLNGSPLKGKSVILSYTVGNSVSWIPIGSANTNDAGEYNIQWVNDASGIFTLKVDWTEDEGYQETVNTTSLSILPYNNQILFHIESNSTVSALAFNSTSLDLSFIVSGPDETEGYVKTTIAKNLVSNPENIQVYLDGNQLNYEVTSKADSWLLAFTYAHSTHQVSINLAENTSEKTILGFEYWTWIVVIIIAIIGIGTAVYFKKHKK